MWQFIEVGNKLEFASTCVEMGMNEEFLESIELVLPNEEKVEIRVEYAWRPIKCNLCKAFRHGIEECKRIMDKFEAKRSPSG